MTVVTELEPGDAARSLLEERDQEWVAALADALHQQMGSRQLERVMRVWDLSRTELGELFGVSRQAVSRWLDDGIPSERAERVADVSAISDLLERHLRRDRVPAVVRREAGRLGDRSLFAMVTAGASGEALRLTRQMFTFSDVHE